MISELKTKIYADGADLSSMIRLNSFDYIKGFTTNPTLMKSEGVKDYKAFALKLLAEINTKPISFEVFSDDLKLMELEAKEISSWGDNVYVKIPITNTKGHSTKDLIYNLSKLGIKINVTAIFTIKQLNNIIDCFDSKVNSNVSIFAGRIADTGVDPVPIMKEALEIIKGNKNLELIWASPREAYNIVQSSNIRCHIITVTTELIKKLNNLNYDLDKFSLDTVKMFYNDAKKAGYKIIS